MDDEIPMRIKRTTKDTQSEIKKKHSFQVIDESSDDEKNKAKQDSQDFYNLDGFKAKEVGQNDEKVNKKSNGYMHHLDDFSEDEKLHDKQHTSLSKDSKYALFDEETDEDLHNNNNTSDEGVWVNINDLPWDPNDWNNQYKFIDDQAEEDLVSSDVHVVPSSSEGDDKDSFIDDESLGYDTTDSQDTDDDSQNTDDDSS